jgi:toxin FitB
MFLLDTNVISELRKPKPHGGVISWFSKQHSQALAIPSVVLYEIQAGAERTRLQDESKARDLDAWITRLPTQITVLPFGSEEAKTTARFLARRPLDLLPDAMIAATAATYGLIVVTRNVKDFNSFPIKLLNPFMTP